uniref:Uncharacterized protein n=1 Tax=Ascaris lumbricoides TaxID=6252 RepID=A0A0M3IW47_ASCLU
MVVNIQLNGIQQASIRHVKLLDNSYQSLFRFKDHFFSFKAKKITLIQPRKFFLLQFL